MEAANQSYWAAWEAWISGLVVSCYRAAELIGDRWTVPIGPPSSPKLPPTEEESSFAFPEYPEPEPDNEEMPDADELPDREALDAFLEG